MLAWKGGAGGEGGRPRPSLHTEILCACAPEEVFLCGMASLQLAAVVG